MKYLTLALLLLSGCTNNNHYYNVGDCFIYDSRIYKIIAIEKSSAEVIDTFGDKNVFTRNGLEHTTPVSCFDRFGKEGK